MKHSKYTLTSTYKKRTQTHVGLREKMFVVFSLLCFCNVCNCYTKK